MGCGAGRSGGWPRHSLSEPGRKGWTGAGPSERASLRYSVFDEAGWMMAGQMLHTLLVAAAMVLAAPALAQASACAALPQTGPVAAPGPDVEAPATPAADRSLACPDDFRLDLRARVPRCVRPGIKAVDGNPRAACYAAMPLGPIMPITARRRPTRTCAVARDVTIIRVAGANAGLADAAVTVFPDTGITLTTLTATDAKVPEAENPVLQRCFAFECRLVKLEVTSQAASKVQLRIAIPGRDPVVQEVGLRDSCRH